MPRKKTSVSTTEATAEKVSTKSVPKNTAASTTFSKPRVRKQLDPNMYVQVRNGFHGMLNYRDKSTGESYQWTEFGNILDLTVSTLQRARSSQPKFFSENWWLIDDPEVIEYLNAQQYYKNALTYEEFDELFNMSIDDIKEKVSHLSVSQKRGVIYRAKSNIESGSLSDLNIIRALEDVLNTELIYK